MKYLNKSQIDFFNKNGYLLVDNLLTTTEVEEYRNVYEDFLSNKIETGNYRADLAGQSDDTTTGNVVERITQIMIPSRLSPTLLGKSLHLKSHAYARQLLGDDLELDFDMLIDKAPFTNTPTPWHQDCAYWIAMPDTRAVSCWVALDEAIKENGCMWYIPKSHLLPIRPHVPSAKGGGALMCEASEDEAVALEIKPGSCIFHHGATLHYSRGNSTEMRRRAFITNFRPEAMIRFEREKGYDHTGDRKVNNDDALS
ncbi:MAG: phytanoyl-CoA dioxygenase family protein [Bacteroidales bacterium]|nr:phytanoyl-CoA dioxygenase family protein [Bacteroidales bacterium]